MSSSNAKQVISTVQAPAPRKGLYSQAIITGNLVFCSGQTPVDPKTPGQLSEGGIGEHTEQCIANLEAVLQAAGSGLSKVVKVNVYLTDMNDFAAMNEAYQGHWGSELPTRTCIVVKELPRGADVELECVAIL